MAGSTGKIVAPYDTHFFQDGMMPGMDEGAGPAGSNVAYLPPPQDSNTARPYRHAEEYALCGFHDANSHLQPRTPTNFMLKFGTVRQATYSPTHGPTPQPTTKRQRYGKGRRMEGDGDDELTEEGGGGEEGADADTRAGQDSQANADPGRGEGAATPGTFARTVQYVSARLDQTRRRALLQAATPAPTPVNATPTVAPTHEDPPTPMPTLLLNYSFQGIDHDGSWSGMGGFMVAMADPRYGAEGGGGQRVGTYSLLPHF